LFILYLLREYFKRNIKNFIKILIPFLIHQFLSSLLNILENNFLLYNFKNFRNYNLLKLLAKTYVNINDLESESNKKSF